MVTVTCVGVTLGHYSVLTLVSFPQTIIIMHYNHWLTWVSKKADKQCHGYCRHAAQHDRHSKYLVWANRQLRHTFWSKPVHHRPQTLVTFCCFMSCTNQSTTGLRHLLPLLCRQFTTAFYLRHESWLIEFSDVVMRCFLRCYFFSLFLGRLFSQ